MTALAARHRVGRYATVEVASELLARAVVAFVFDVLDALATLRPERLKRS